MAEYIEREQVKDELLSWAVCINHPEHLLKEDALCVIDAIPAADVEVVKRGRWENIRFITTGDGRVKVGDCSACNSMERVRKYCPECGCKMDLEVTDGLDQH